MWPDGSVRHAAGFIKANWISPPDSVLQGYNPPKELKVNLLSVCWSNSLVRKETDVWLWFDWFLKEKVLFFLFRVYPGQPTVVEIVPALHLTIRCATPRSAPAPTRTSGLSSASRGATSTTKTSSTHGCHTSTRTVSGDIPDGVGDPANLTRCVLFLGFCFFFVVLRGPKV